ncbi:RelA/SpoT family protein [Patescibacteria group bacterium]|nr:RelA/SpoT family protein [Patescibacteria group bacterium]MBU1891096.1 RelA/SpoT family protein [Patescibacteria group bacterium]
MSKVSPEILLEKIKKYGLRVDPKVFKQACAFAKSAHQGQVRLSGEQYINHPLLTADTLIELRMDQATIIAGLLHDVPEDTDESIHEIKRHFGDEVAFLVEGVTKLGKIKYRGVEQYLENLRKMFVAMAADIRVILIRLADRMHNMSTLSSLRPDKQKRIALETLEIYAPIANRLGIGEIKGTLEDLAFQYVNPDEYTRVKKLFDQETDQQKDCYKEIKKKVRKELALESIKPIDIHGRTKHLYSLHKKLIQHDNDIKLIYDLTALRIIVNDIKDCYATLGIIHKLWRPLKGRIKDYIATPKPNGYQSIHTTVFCDNGTVVEFQIRDKKMHDLAEHGIAAHWQYSEQDKRSALPQKKLAWIDQLLNWQKKLHDNKKYLESLKIDAFQNRIFVFTPNGDVIDLPEDSTPVDFAYSIHTELGNQCAGAKINDKMSSLDSALKSGDLCEIIIDKKRTKPNRDWLKSIKTSNARYQIRTTIKK